MERAEDERSHLGGGDGERDGLEVAHLAHQDDVRVLADGSAQRRAECLRVAAHLAVRDHGVDARVYELHRILDGHDVLVLVPVDGVDDGREGRRLPRSGRTRHQDQPALQVAERRDGRAQVQVFQRGDVFGDEAKDGAGAVLLPEVVGTEARRALESVGEVDVAAGLVALPVLGLGDLQQEISQARVVERLPAIHRLQRAVPPDSRLETGHQVEVGAAAFLELREQLVELCHEPA